mmetsp:Transcript_23255/g.20132  ORF Transcript_23255/g.20132 Transcript_23255/m.20132 type:complete len:230 (+) Transcript_23255:329-1018(+)|eukprot:CAMPEP_0114589714 /NCGR_PEP_ID=MMETSP0125-20121206/12106_1 /TAXON_ID=485358 ORGANISM="Aristerostoma sp., Strain ATCC 50986" /NCGR_SAMPLE_ID=MMETSP0125 /ASSEMBLY_ACC=CAM_ASM_000245 /LENGTH=229 /DNA_ID=CAMNT_0001786765 /DNA_START=259 /DNA_END=948 /DNA_ORIENTATION=-
MRYSSVNPINHQENPHVKNFLAFAKLNDSIPFSRSKSASGNKQPRYSNPFSTAATSANDNGDGPVPYGYTPQGSPIPNYSGKYFRSPFKDGKRDPKYVNNSTLSNEVFYDHEYGYVNDLPNDRLLGPVKNDKFSAAKTASKWASKLEPQPNTVAIDLYSEEKKPKHRRTESQPETPRNPYKTQTIVPKKLEFDLPRNQIKKGDQGIDDAPSPKIPTPRSELSDKPTKYE